MGELNIPENATFRRAEGLHFVIDLCGGTHRFHVTASRQNGQIQMVLSVADAELLTRLSRWQTADEVDAPFEKLVELVRANCLFWSTTRPARDLTGDVLAPLEGKVALAKNVRPIVSVSTDDGVRELWHMPRRGELDRASLGAIAFATLEMHAVVGWTSVRCCKRHIELVRELLPLLDGRHDVGAIARDAERRGFIEALGRLGRLERYAPPAWTGEPRLTWLAHAGILYEACGKRILIDPLLFPLSEPSRIREIPFDPRNFGDIDAVLVTHGDHDHLNPNTLVRLPADVPVIIPRAGKVEPYQVDMFQLLSVIGCRRIIEVDEWERLTFGDVTVVATPFRGEDWGLTLPCRTYVVDSPKLSIFANADSTSTPDVYERLAKEFKIDVAFVGVTGAAEVYAMPPGYGYGDFYAGYIPEERENEWVQLCNGPKEAAAAARQLGARYAVGYAAGGETYCELAYCDRGSHGELARILLESGSRTKPLDLAAGVPARIER